MDLMSLDMEPKTGTPQPPRSSRARWLVVAVAVAVVVIAAISSLVLWLGEDDDGPTAAPTPVPTTPVPTQPAPSAAPSTSPSAAATGQPKTARLTLSPEPARCLLPSVVRLRTATLAFEASVDQIGPDHVLLAVRRDGWRRADGFGGTNTVRVDLPGARTDSPVTFAAGKTYLVAATGDGQVMSCGLSGVETPRLSKLYAAAF